MKYMLLVHHDEAVLNALAPRELQALRTESVQLCHEIHAHGQYLDASPLHLAATGDRKSVV